MPFFYLKLIMAVLVLALIMIILLGLRVARIIPKISFSGIRLLEIDRRRLLFRPDRSWERWAENQEELALRRARTLARPRNREGDADNTAMVAATFFDEAMLNLERAFDSFEAGRIGADTYRSLVRSVRRAAGKRRAGLAARDEVLESADDEESEELKQAIAVVEAADWCLNWIDDYERLCASANASAISADCHARSQRSVLRS